MTAQTSSLMLLMSFAAGTFSAGASNNPQHLMFASPSAGVPNNPLPLIIWPRVVPEDEENIATWFEETFEKNGWPPEMAGRLTGAISCFPICTTIPIRMSFLASLKAGRKCCLGATVAA